jgi:coenzyme F420-dependent glucose-6-phosphate dehydrogenase
MTDKGKNRTERMQSGIAGGRPMVELGYGFSCKHHTPHDLIRYTQQAEQADFTFALLADSAHPWGEAQEHSPFVWSIVGALAATTQRLRLGIGVTRAMLRLHPAVIAQAAATVATMLPQRFFLNIDSDDSLHEYLRLRRSPVPDQRLEMLEEAVRVIRLLWSGGTQHHWGPYYTVENAGLATLPEVLPAILIAAERPCTAEVGGRIGDGLIGTTPNSELLATFQAAGGANKPRYGKMTVCWARNTAAAERLAQQWRVQMACETAAQGGPKPPQVVQDPAAKQVINGNSPIVCGADPARHLAAIHAFVKAGYDAVYIEQAGAEQAECIRFYQRHILPKVL